MNFKNCYRPEDVYIFCQKFTKIRDKNGCVVLRNDVIYGYRFKKDYMIYDINYNDVFIFPPDSRLSIFNVSREYQVIWLDQI